MFHLFSKHPSENRVSYLKHYEFDENGNKISVPQHLRRIWLDEEAAYIKDKNLPVYIICGEFSSTDTVQYALEKGFDVKVICGEHILDKKSQDTVVHLKEKYGDKFTISIYSSGEEKRPPYHSALIGRNLFFENKHPAIKDGEPVQYETAKVIEQISADVCSQYNYKFNEYLKRCTIQNATVDDIKKMGTLLPVNH